MGRHAKNSGKPKKRQGWATDMQHEFLVKSIPAYLAATASKKSSDFWPPFWEIYFEQFPLDQEQTNGMAESERLSKMKKVSKRTNCNIGEIHTK